MKIEDRKMATEKRKKWLRENKDKLKEIYKKYEKSEKGKKKRKEYYSRDDIKEKRKAYYKKWRARKKLVDISAVTDERVSGD